MTFIAAACFRTWASVLLLLLCTPLRAAVLRSSGQVPFGQIHEIVNDGPRLHGRFLHLTDLHPDPFYKSGTKESSLCHGKVHAEEEGSATFLKQRRAGPLGLPVSECDAPFELINATFSYLRQDWAGKVDFVIWTGDNARHDNDNRLPRSMKQITELNSYISEMLIDTFGKDIPIIPSIGNNDIYPHNVMSAGPNQITSSFARLWKHYIPEEQYHLFQRGAYFAVDVIPNLLAVISLNTLYFYDSNKIVDGCEKRSEPGTLEMQWLEVQLRSYRQRNMQVYLTGHVPPSRATYSLSCFELYRDLSLQYQDTILGHFYGHMNVDHFFMIGEGLEDDDVKLEKDHRSDTKELLYSNNLAEELLHSFVSIPSRERTDLADYAIIHVNPSVVPTYLPSLRVWTYNTSIQTRYMPNKDSSSRRLLSRVRSRVRSMLAPFRTHGLTSFKVMKHRSVSLHRSWTIDEMLGTFAKKKKHHKGKRRKGRKSRFPKKGRYTSPASPARSNRFLTPISYVQMYLELEIAPKSQGSLGTSNVNLSSPISQEAVDTFAPLADVPDIKSGWQTEYATDTSGPGEYHLPDGSIGSWLDLARSMGKDSYRSKRDLMHRDSEGGKDEGHESNLWNVFEKRMYVSSR